MLAGYAAGAFSPLDVADAVIARIDAWEPHLNALYAFDRDAVRSSAAASAERWRAGRPQGALDGVPVTIKENVATRGIPVPLGTDIGGSIRLPAAWCGVFGFKPSHGRVPIHPGYQGRVAGPLARSVADAALMMRVLSVQDDPRVPRPPGAPPFDPTALPPQALPWHEIDAEVGPVAIGVWRDAGWGLPVDAAADAFAAAGARVETLGAFTTRRFDFVLSPTTPVPAFPAGQASPLDDPGRPFEHIAFTLPFNMSEQPAASIDCGRTAAGLPIGLQIAGRRFDDVGVLRLARAWERLRGEPPAWPEPPGGA